MITISLIHLLLAASVILLLAINAWSNQLVFTKSALTFSALAVLATWWFINRLSGNGLNYATLYHLQTGLRGAGFADFSREIIALLAFYVGAFLIAGTVAMCAKRLVRPQRANTIPYFLALAVFIAANPLTLDLYKLRRWDHMIADNKVAAEYRAIPGTLNLKGKNIVIIYGESLERTYLDETIFPDLMPNVSRLSKEAVDFTNIAQAEGTGWTVAGIVASLCGIPLTIWDNADANHLDRLNKFLPGALCLPDYLSDRGYRTEFIGGASANFAGKERFLSSHGFTTVRDVEYFRHAHPEESNFSSWGVHDDVLLNTAFDRFRALSSQKQPFLLTVLTLDTHHPSGHVPAACGDQAYKGLGERYPILDAISCSDRLIGDLIDKIRNSPMGSNTCIVLASDHLAMPNDVSEILGANTDKRRNLLMIFDSDAKPAKIGKPATTVDSGSTLLSLLTHGSVPVGFGRPANLPARDGLTRALITGQDVQPYYAYSRMLWMLDASPRIAITGDGMLRMGDQELDPPLMFKIGNKGAPSDISFNAGTKVLSPIPVSTGYIDYCAAFYTAPAAAWCLLLSDEQGRQVLVDEGELRNGIDLSDKARFKARRQYEITHDFIVQRGFPPSYPYLIKGVANHRAVFSNLSEGVLFNGPFATVAAGDYRVIIRGSASSPKASWADVISDGGKTVHAHHVLLDSLGSGRVFDQTVHLQKTTENVEIRVYAAAGEPIRIDGFELVPVHQTARSP